MLSDHLLNHPSLENQAKELFEALQKIKDYFESRNIYKDYTIFKHAISRNRGLVFANEFLINFYLDFERKLNKEYPSIKKSDFYRIAIEIMTYWELLDGICYEKKISDVRIERTEYTWSEKEKEFSSSKKYIPNRNLIQCKYFDKEKLTCKLLAERSQKQPFKHFCNKKSTGSDPYKHFNEARISNILNLLRNDIDAYRLTPENKSYFSRKFKSKN